MPLVERVLDAPATFTPEARWRLEKQNAAKGVRWLLARGSAAGRRFIDLGYVAEAEAQRLQRGINELVRVRNGFDAMWRAQFGGQEGASFWSPVKLDAPIAYPERQAEGSSGGARITLTHGPDWLLAVKERARTGEEKERARDIVMTYLAHLADAMLPSEDEIAAFTGEDIRRMARENRKHADPGGLPLADYFESMWSPHAENEKYDAGSWKKTKGHWTRYLLPSLGHVPMRDLEAVRFEEFICNLGKNGGKRATEFSVSTLRLIRAAYKACLKHARRKGHIPAIHEFFELEVGRPRSLARPVPLTPPEIQQLIDAARTPMHKALFAFAFDEGGRPTENISLELSDVFFDDVSEGCPFGRVRIPGTKTAASDGVIPLWPRARKHMLEWGMASGRPAAGPVFAWKGKPYTGESTYRTALKNAAKRAGLDGRRIFPYLSRHTFATAALMDGANAKDVAMVMRHTNTKMVEATYGHAEPADRVDVRRFGRRGSDDE